MKWNLVRRSRANAKVRSRPPMTFEQLEHRNLLSADLWHASGVFAQPTLATNTISSEQVGRWGGACAQPATSPLSYSPQSSLSLQHSSGPRTAAARGGRSAAVVDDLFENNDTFAQAANLGSLSQPTTIQNLVMADQADWFQFQLSQPTDASSTVSIQFQHSQGDLDLAFYDANGRLLSYSNGTSNSESISLAGRSAGIYYVYVYGYRGTANPNYSLTIAVATSTPTPVTPTPVTPAQVTPTAPTSGYQIDLNMSGLTATQQAIFQQAAAQWSQAIVGDLPNMTYNGRTVDDLLIDVSASSIDGAGGILGQAGPDRLRPGSRLPYHGSMQFDSADLAQMQANGTLLGVVMHEIGHVLGIGTIWQNLGLLAGAGSSNPTFIGALATAAYNASFGTHANVVPVENSGGAGTRDGHWRESIFGNELMTGYVGPGLSLPLSRVTIASLADLGYQVI